MSFGFSIGDFIAVGKLAQSVYRSCRDAPESFSNISMEVLSLHAVLTEIHEIIAAQELSPARQNSLTVITLGCQGVLNDLQALVSKYEGLGKSKRTWDRLKWGTEDIKELRSRLTSNTVLLTAFMSTCQIVVEKKLNKLAQEFQDGKHEGSMISSVTVASLTQDDQETWREIRKEFEHIGISVAAFDANKSFILAWFESALSNGAFMENGDLEDSGSENASLRSHKSIRSNESFRSDESVRTLPMAINRPASKPSLPAMPPRNATTSTPHIPLKQLPQNNHVSSQKANPNGGQLPQENRLLMKPIPKPNPKKPPRIVSLFSRAFGEDRAFINALAPPVDYAKARRCIDNGVDINAKIFKDGYSGYESAMFRAIRCRDPLTVKWILDQGVDPDTTIPWTAGPESHHSGSLLPRILCRKLADITMTDFEMAQACLDHGADINGIGPCNNLINSSLYAAVVFNKVDVVKWLLDRGADARIIESSKRGRHFNEDIDMLEETAFHAAAGCGNTKLLHLLLANTGNIEIRNVLEQSALHIAVQTCLSADKTTCSLTTIVWLLDHGANINALDSHKKSPIIYAISNNDLVPAAKLLLEHGSIVGDIGNINSVSLARNALMCSRDDMALMLLEKSIHLSDLRGCDEDGNTLLHAAALGACFFSYKRLRELGLSYRTQNKRGHTPCQAAQDFLDYDCYGGMGPYKEGERERTAAKMRLFLVSVITSRLD